MSKKHCKNCNLFAQSDEDIFCTECGTKLILKNKAVAKSKYCKNCNKYTYSKEDTFCTECGTKLVFKKEEEVKKRKYCISCENFSSSEEEIYCTNCGAKLTLREYKDNTENQPHTPTQTYTQEYNTKKSSDGNLVGIILVLLFIGAVIYFIAAY